MEFVDKEFVNAIINMAFMTNFDSKFNIILLSGLYTAIVSGIISLSYYAVSVLRSIDGWVIHLVVIEIHIDVALYFDFTNAGLRVILWAYVNDLHLVTGEGELIIVVYVTILIVGNAAESMIYHRRDSWLGGFNVLCLIICILV